MGYSLFKNKMIKAISKLNLWQKPIGGRTLIQIKHEVKESDLVPGGSGLFSLQPVKEGEAVWRFDNTNCEKFNKETIGDVDEARLGSLLWTGYLTKNMEKF